MENSSDAVSRREALKRTALLLGGAIAVPALPGCGRRTDEEASGEQSGAETAAGATEPQRPIGLQLYTVRDRMEQDVAATLASVAEVGYTEVEFAGYFERTPDDIRATLDNLGLAAPSAHVPIETLRSSLDDTLAAARVLGHQYLVVPWLDETERTVEGFRRVAADLNRFGTAAGEQGMRMAYHNHDFEFQPLAEGRTGFDILLEETEPSLVDLELDLFWATKGGHDPVDLFARHPGRFPLWHVKDMADLQGAQQMVAVGQGAIDFGRIFAQAEQAGLRHFFVEHDNPEDSLASIRTSYQHLRQLLS